MEEKKETQAVEIYPLGKWKRLFLGLADVFLCGILTMIFFHFMVFPIASSVTSYQDQISQVSEHENRRDSVLYEADLLFYDASSNTKASSFSKNLDYSYSYFVRLYSVGDVDAKYDVFKTYATLRGEEAVYASFFSTFDPKGTYFSFVSGTATLNEPYKEEFKAFFTPGDSPSSSASTHYEEMENSFFLRSYSKIINDILEKEDLVQNGISYRTEQETMTSISRSLDYIITISTAIAFVVSVGVLFVLVPLITANKKTLAMLMMKRERVDSSSLRIFTGKRIWGRLFYEAVAGVSLCFFTPFPLVGIDELFILPVFPGVCLVSLAFLLASLIFVIADPFNRTLGDFLTKSIVLEEASLDQIYRTRGYKL